MNKEILLVIETVSNEKNVSKDVIIDAIEAALAQGFTCAGRTGLMNKILLRPVPASPCNVHVFFR